jgi:NADH-quinone oxidoreductase subunit L
VTDAAPEGAAPEAALAAEPEIESAGEGGSLELTLMVVSSLIAILGIGIASFIWLKRRQIADAMADRLSGNYRRHLNKYYDDEQYDAAIVHPIKVLSTEGLWRGFDVKVIDGAVNGTAAIVSGGASVLRRLQSGSVRAYAGGLFVGVVLILGYYLWR